MANQEIGGLTLAAALTGTELSHVVQGGNSRRVPLSTIVKFTKMADLSDVDLTGLDDQYLLEYDGTSSQWKVVLKPKMSVIEQTTNYTLTDADLTGNRLITLASASAISLNIPAGLTAKEPVTIIQKGGGQVSIVAGASVTIFSADSKVALRTQYSSATLIPDVANNFYLVGDLA